MSYKVLLKKSVEKELDNLPENIYKRILSRLFSLKENPRPSNTKKIRGDMGFRIRVGDYRVLYEIEDKRKIVEVYSIAHRREVYR